MSDLVEELKDRLSIETVLIACGARLEPSWSSAEIQVFCPFHPNVNTPAGSANIVKQLYYCYACEAKGDIISIARLHLRQEGQDDSFQAALRWLGELAA